MTLAKVKKEKNSCVVLCISEYKIKKEKSAKTFGWKWKLILTYNTNILICKHRKMYNNTDKISRHDSCTSHHNTRANKSN